MFAGRRHAGAGASKALLEALLDKAGADRHGPDSGPRDRGGDASIAARGLYARTVPRECAPFGGDYIEEPPPFWKPFS